MKRRDLPGGNGNASLQRPGKERRSVRERKELLLAGTHLPCDASRKKSTQRTGRGENLALRERGGDPNGRFSLKQDNGKKTEERDCREFAGTD